MTGPLLFLYASHDGHTSRIAQRLKERLATKAVFVIAFDLARETPEDKTLLDAPFLLILSPIRYGFHLAPVERFLKTHKKLVARKNLAMASVNLTARKDEKNAPETNPYFRKWIRRHKLCPTLGAVFAGRLDYKLYPAWEKWIIRLIMTLTKGPTNLDACVDFTDWNKVDAFADLLATRSRAREAA